MTWPSLTPEHLLPFISALKLRKLSKSEGGFNIFFAQNKADLHMCIMNNYYTVCIKLLPIAIDREFKLSSGFLPSGCLDLEVGERWSARHRLVEIFERNSQCLSWKFVHIVQHLSSNFQQLFTAFSLFALIHLITFPMLPRHFKIALYSADTFACLHSFFVEWSFSFLFL